MLIGEVFISSVFKGLKEEAVEKCVLGITYGYTHEPLHWTFEQKLEGIRRNQECGSAGNAFEVCLLKTCLVCLRKSKFASAAEAE